MDDPESLSQFESQDITIQAAQTSEDVAMVRELFQEYLDTLTQDLSFQNFEHELRDLPGEYAPPYGFLLLVYIDNHLAGCGAVRALENCDYVNACEMRRLYVRPAFRRFGVGRMLVEALLERAQAIGYSVMVLDALDEMESARELYTSFGFEEIPPYYYNPLPGARYLKLDL